MKNKIFLLSFLVFFLILLTGCSNKGGDKKMADLTAKRILMVIAPNNFRDEEFQRPKAVFEDLGAQVTVASKGVKEARGMLGATVQVDIDLSQVEMRDYQALVFVGGSGAEVYFNDPLVLNLAKTAASQNKPIGAICIAPSILANAGLLKGKKATAFSSEASNLSAKGAIYTAAKVVQAGKIVTASGPEAARDFGETIAKIIK